MSPWFADDAEASLWTQFYKLNWESLVQSEPINLLVGGMGAVKTAILRSFKVQLRGTSSEKEIQQQSGFLFPIDPVDLSRSDAGHFQIESTQALLERERLKTELLVAQRDLLEQRESAKETQASSDRRIARLLRQNDGQLDCIRDLSLANAKLQQALINRTDGRLSMHEHNSGVVVDCVDDHVAVRYETGEGPVEQVYHVDQFACGQVPKTGDRIEAHVFAWRSNHEPKGIEHYLTPEEIEHAREAFEKGTTGPVES